MLLKLLGGLVGVVLLGWLFVFSFGQHYVAVDPGHEVVLIDRPYFFGKEGARPETLKEGRELVFNSTASYAVNMTPQAITIDYSDLVAKDNNRLNFSSTIEYRITDPVLLITKYGPNWFEHNIKNQYSNIVRTAVKGATMPEMLSDINVSSRVDQEVRSRLMSIITAKGIPVEIISISLGRALPNEEVMKEMNNTAAQQQRKLTVNAFKEAENAREEAEKASAKADFAYMKELNIDIESYIELKRLEKLSEICKNNTCIIDATGSNSAKATIQVQR